MLTRTAKAKSANSSCPPQDRCKFDLHRRYTAQKAMHALALPKNERIGDLKIGLSLSYLSALLIAQSMKEKVT